MTEFIRLPVVKPNGPGGTFLVGSPLKGATPYPDGTQTHAVVRARFVVAVCPVRVGDLWPQDFLGGSCVRLLDGVAVYTTIPVEEVLEMLGGSAL